MCADIQTVPVLVLPSQNSLSQPEPEREQYGAGAGYKHQEDVHNDDPNTNYHNLAPSLHPYHHIPLLSTIFTLTIYLVCR